MSDHKPKGQGWDMSDGGAYVMMNAFPHLHGKRVVDTIYVVIDEDEHHITLVFDDDTYLDILLDGENVWRFAEGNQGHGLTPQRVLSAKEVQDELLRKSREANPSLIN